jgi:hypothetical protein
MAVAAVVDAADPRERAQLLRRQHPVWNRDAQHRRVLLDVEPVLQPQRPEVVLRKLADQKAARLVAKLGDPFADQTAVEGVVAVHGHDGTGRSK